MKIFVDSKSKIRAVDNTNDSTLTPIELSPNEHKFDGWSNAKICCYRVSVSNGFITMMTPYIDSRNLEMIDNMGHQIDITSDNTKVATETMDGIMTDMLPTLTETDESITATIDYIMTDVIPSLMGE